MSDTRGTLFTAYDTPGWWKLTDPSAHHILVNRHVDRRWNFSSYAAPVSNTWSDVIIDGITYPIADGLLRWSESHTEGSSWRVSEVMISTKYPRPNAGEWELVPLAAAVEAGEQQ